MSIKQYDKLVRLHIPEIIRDKGNKPITYSIQLKAPGTLPYLKKKISEEVEELLKAKSRDQIIEEAADVLEIIMTYVGSKGVSPEELVSVAVAKNIKCGPFIDKDETMTVLDSVENNDRDL